MRFLKSFLPGLAALLLISLNCRCGKFGGDPDDPDARALKLDGDDLIITYAPGDSAESVTGNVILPASGAKGCRIEWASGNDAAITIEGIVNRPAAEKEN